MFELKQLQTKKGRDEYGLFIVEGEKFVEEIPENIEVVQFLLSKGFAARKDRAAYEFRARCEVVRDSLFNKLADTVTPQGIIAVCRKQETAPHVFKKINMFVLIGENISDPGNVGNLVRTAAAVGADGLVFTEGSADPLGPKAIRASAGAALRLPLLSNLKLAEALAALARVPIYAAHPKGDVLPYNLRLAEPFALIIGNEAHGLSDEAISSATALVCLPMKTATESLNASVAGSVLMYEALRQRLQPYFGRPTRCPFPIA